MTISLMKCKSIMRTLILFLLVTTGLNSQTSIDQDAKNLLDRVSQSFEAAKRLSIDFELIIRFSESNQEIQKGKLLQDQERFRIQIGNQEIINNGEDIYMILKDQNIAQLNSAISSIESSEADLMNPRELMKMYKSGDYEYGIVGEEDVDGKRLVLVEFKPLDRYAEYSKMRIAIEKTNEQPVYFKIFNKDGTQYTLMMTKLDFRPTISDTSFKFNQSEYPGITLEDLRID